MHGIILVLRSQLYAGDNADASSVVLRRLARFCDTIPRIMVSDGDYADAFSNSLVHQHGRRIASVAEGAVQM